MLRPALRSMPGEVFAIAQPRESLHV